MVFGLFLELYVGFGFVDVIVGNGGGLLCDGVLCSIVCVVDWFFVCFVVGLGDLVGVDLFVY